MATTAQPDRIKAEAAEAAPAEKAPVKSRRPQIIALAVLTVAGLGLGGYYAMHAGLESTDDAQVEADVVAVPSRVGGVVMKVGFVDNQTVKAGDVLAELDDAQAKAKLAQAEADLASAKATADAADSDVTVTQ